MTILAIYNIKGGVGKTATAVNLAFLSAREGNRTLIWDLDPQGATSFYFRVRAKVKGGAKKLIAGKRDLEKVIRGTDFDALDLLPADFSYRNLALVLGRSKKPEERLARLLIPLVSRYEYVFIDCAPGSSLVSESVFVAADALVVPTVPTTLSLLTLDRIRKRLSKMERRRPLLLPFLCMVDRRRGLHRDVRDQVLADREFLNAQIPYASIVERMGIHRAPLAVFAGTSEPALAYEALWQEIKARLRGEGERQGPVRGEEHAASASDAPASGERTNVDDEGRWTTGSTRDEAR